MTLSSCFAPVQQARLVKGAAPKVVFKMAQEEDAPKQPETFQDGTFYDDEIDSAPKKDGISDSMKAKLLAEATSGLDSETKQSNSILYIMGAMAVLVVLGGKGIFY
eukprot:CAMPEP_0194238118 /NCGR_PEP_ID=MMETSP0158-20130606/4947_1 /TAXON_ID=33649 /ORGANISM="Thalassionema nitzschioides, Strain L26-B" /LENGTH=105 /DNA_ID=CAMNT_0038972303 /DNA_START=65 /DNA_END=382 /DNA_ORIENTATION=-